MDSDNLAKRTRLHPGAGSQNGDFYAKVRYRSLHSLLSEISISVHHPRGLGLPFVLHVRFSSSCLWRIDTVGVKRSDPRSAQQPRAQAPDDLIGSLPKVERIPERSRVFGKSRSHWCLIFEDLKLI
jgi:hypothetical protein